MIQYRLAFATVGDNRGAETTAAKKKVIQYPKKTLKLATASIKRID
jgi:hypothetical protein